ncbi:MAG: hypothetical protein K2G55_12270 [Lachnospiraceae bacterium]|nr:hypothetical protein [Lachnospiraceae bacterium]MDE7205102.1 hypothetical protein [Lachnospiraceae bacterium]
MDFIKMLREDSDLSDLLYDVCDVEILSELRSPQDENGHLTYNLSGKTFAKAKSGSEYILLEDGSVGYWGSEGKCGRIADNLKEFLEFMVNCPYWQDYLYEEEYEDRESLEEFAEEVYEEHVENDAEIEFDLPEAQQELADCLGIEKKADVVSILMRFYDCTKREPRLIYTYTEADGSTHSGTGSLFDN